LNAYLVSRSKALCVLALILSAAAWFGAVFCYLEMLTPFRPHYLALVLFCAAIFTWAGQWKWTGVAVAAASLNLIAIAPAYLPTKSGLGTSVSLRVVSANVNADNDRFASFIDWARHQQPDVIIAQEISPAWARALKPLAADYPYHMQVPRNDNFGISAFSRLPMHGQKILFPGSAGAPSLLLEVTAGKRKLSILATHPVPPINREFFDRRNKQLDAVAGYMAQLKGVRMVIGDFNISTWSPYFTDMRNRSGLKNASDGFGILPTWPAVLPGLMIPLDHCLVSQDMTVQNIRTGGNTGSDHLPLFVHVAF